MAEVPDPAFAPLGRGATLTRRSYARLLRHGFQLLGGMERRELVEMLAVHAPPKAMVDLVRERVPDGTRVPGLRALWDYLGDLPLGEPLRDAGDEETLLQIGEVAERVGLSLRSVRYYDEAGLVPPSARSDGNFRLYSERDVERLSTVKMMKPLGLSVDEMRELDDGLARTAEPELLCAAEAEEATRDLAAFAERGDERIATLERDLEQARTLRARIGEHIARCSNRS